MLAALLAIASLAGSWSANSAPAAHAAATCSQYSNQAAAQRAHDTRDADGDGIYCESLPCPCAGPSRAPSRPSRPTTNRPTTTQPAGCIRTKHVQPITFSATKYPNIRAHMLRALRKGWPGTLVLNRPGAAARRDRLLADVPTRAGYDRDEYPPAVGRGRGHHLTFGSDPTGWRADVEYVPSAENRSHGSTMGIKLRRFCDGQLFRYVFY
jgi:hypothetical protein